MGAHGGEAGGRVGLCPGEEEEHGWGALCFCSADGGDDAFEVVLRGCKWRVERRGVRGRYHDDGGDAIFACGGGIEDPNGFVGVEFRHGGGSVSTLRCS